MIDRPVRREARDQNTVRLVAGHWRGRKIHFPDGEGLRPTPARVRETLFNWLMHDVRDARVLDLFAGSGALAFEALSRGAREATLIDASAVVCRQLQQELAGLKGARGSVLREDAFAFLARQREPFDLVFVDPPFHAGLAARAPAALEASGALAPRAWIYVESETSLAAGSVPGTWRLHRELAAGQSHAALYRREAA